LGRGQQPADRLGARVSAPGASLVEQLDLPKGQGLLVEGVTRDSPASKAGLKANDILLEIAGKPVGNTPETLARQIAGIEGNKAVDVVVMRKGKKETLKGLTFPEAKKPDRDFGRPLGRLPGNREPLDRRVEVTSMLNLHRSGDQFNVFSREGTRTIQARGTLADGKVKTVSIQIVTGRDSQTYDSVEKVPAESRDEVKALLALCEKKVAQPKGRR
jgi:hypothetical protein